MRSRVTIFPLALLSFHGINQAMAKTTYWLNQVAGYSSLPPCAEKPLSYIVRDMVSGCGDGGSATSYSCFCTASSQDFQDIIATSVADECGSSGEQVASATSLFHQYCLLNKVATTTSLSSSQTDSDAVPASTSSSGPATPAQATFTPLPPPTQASAPNDETSLPTSAKIAIGVCVPVTIIAIVTLAVFLIKRRRSSFQRVVSPTSTDTAHDVLDKHAQDYSATNPGYAHAVYRQTELEGSTCVHELPPDDKRQRTELP